MTVQRELSELFAENEKTTVGDVLAWARRRPRSALYHELKFNDDATAAELWRRHHVRRLIAIHIVDVSGQRLAMSLSIDRSTGGGYRALTDILQNVRMRDVLLHDALNELHRIEDKYNSLEALNKVWKAVREAEEEAEESVDDH